MKRCMINYSKIFYGKNKWLHYSKPPLMQYDMKLKTVLLFIANTVHRENLRSVIHVTSHSHKQHLRQIAFTVFNINAKNFVSWIKDKLRKAKTAKCNVMNSNWSNWKCIIVKTIFNYIFVLLFTFFLLSSS